MIKPNGKTSVVAACYLTLLLTAGPTLAQPSDAAQERGFVDSVAATIYGFAWPTATYKQWRVKSIEPADHGIDFTARLSGESLFGGELWLDLLFRFRNGGFGGMAPVGHNAVLFPPFATIGAFADAAQQVAHDAAAKRAANPSATAPPATNSARVLHALRVQSGCGHPVSLWIAVLDAQGRWRKEGLFPIGPGGRATLADASEVPLQLSSNLVYYYAEMTDGSYTWEGAERVSIGTRTFPMRELRVTAASDGAFDLPLDCPNYVER